MLAQKNRLTRTEFNEYFKQGRVYHGELLYVRVVQVKDSPDKKFSCVVSKKVAKSAVKRHLIKRRVYNALRELFPTIQSGVVAMVFMKKSEQTPNFARIKLEVEQLLTQAKVVTSAK